MAKVATFFIMLAFWVVLSGMFDPFHLTLGLICCALVAHFSSPLLFPKGSIAGLRQAGGMLLYLPWLFYQILVANLQVVYIVLHPRMLELIEPKLIRFRTKLKTPFARITFAQSITLTPGTITVNVDGDEFTVYALTRASAADLPGEMERRIARALEGGV